MDSKTINCQDFGEIKIQEYITIGQIEKYYNVVKNNPKIAVDSLISSIIMDNINIQELSTTDKIEILSKLSEEFETLDLFKEQLSDEVEYQQAFNNAFKSSDFYKSLTKTYKGIESMIAPSIAMAKMNQTILNNYTGFFAIQEVAKSITRMTTSGITDLAKITGSFDIIRQNILSYNKTIKQIQFPLTNQLLTSKIIKQQRIVDQTKVFRDFNKLSSFNLEHLKSISAHNKKLFEPLSILSKRNLELNTVFGLSNSALANLRSSIAYIKSTSKINWFDQLNITSKIINSCNIAISSTNDYFVDAKYIKPVFYEELELETNEDEKFKEISNSIIKSEIIIQDRAGSSIIIQNEFAQILFDKMDSLQEGQKKYKKVFDHFEQFLNPQAFSDFLDEFVEIVSREYWKQFWRDVGNTFKSAPESIAKSNLGMFLSGRFSNVAFIGQELMAGNGFVDLLVNYLGLNYLVELKVIGANTPISWAKSGINQLNDYMEKYNLDKGYLVIYDGRKTDRGEQLEDHYDVSNGRIFVKKIKIYYSDKK